MLAEKKTRNRVERPLREKEASKRPSHDECDQNLAKRNAGESTSVRPGPNRGKKNISLRARLSH